jgi:CHAD domain-containing protein
MSVPSKYIFSLIHQLKLLTDKPISKEVIHDLRVLIKRLKALWAIHPMADTITFNKIFPNIKRLFRLGAHTRDLQVIETCLRSLPDFSKYPILKQQIREEIKIEKRKLDRKMHNAGFQHAVKDELHKFSTYFKLSSSFLLKESRKKYRLTVEEHMGMIDPSNADKLHELRKMVKNLMYQSEAFHSYEVNKKLHHNEISLESIQRELGHWHDWWNTLQWLHIHDLHTQKLHIELIDVVKGKEASLKRELTCHIRTFLKNNAQPA